ncbi:MAG: AarF/UbiB family protein [Anaerolineales bacterium]
MYRSRYCRIVWFFGRVLIALIWWEVILPKLGLTSLVRQSRHERLRKIATRFRSLAIEMGGVMIKVGQFLSARLDVLPRVITDELAGLQDEVRPEAFSEIRRVVEAEFGMPLEEKYICFEENPIASASIGQVHRARLRKIQEGTDIAMELLPVVVKVQRPDIERIVSIDLSALRVVAEWVYRYPPVKKRADVRMLMDEFSRTLYEELDYLSEGKNAETFAENFRNDSEVVVPEVIWSHTTRRVLTLQDVQAIKITDYDAIKAAGIQRSNVAQRLFNTYLKQIFEDSFFHADPHPGNLFVLPISKDEDIGEVIWKLVFVDFGMVGHISPQSLAGMQELLIAVGTRDSSRMIKAYQMLGVLLPGADLELLERANMEVFEQFWGKSTSELVELGHEEAMAFLRKFEDLLYEMPFQLPENFVLLGRCLGILSGMCTGLDKEFNVWTSIVPYAERLMRDERSTRLRNLLDEAFGILRTTISLPVRADAIIKRMEQGRLEVRSSELSQQIVRLERTLRKLVGAIVFMALLLGGVQLYLGGEVILAGALGLVAGFAFLWLLLSR